MTVEIFDIKTFEAALPTHKDTGESLWKYVGMVQRERTYRVSINPDISIIIRSSIDGSGLSAETGKDSIRAWLVNANDHPLGSKVSKYTTRVKGWEDRLTKVLRTLWEMAQAAGYCEQCNVPNGIFIVKNGKPKNRGRMFRKCPNCGGNWSWVEVMK